MAVSREIFYRYSLFRISVLGVALVAALVAARKFGFVFREDESVQDVFIAVFSVLSGVVVAVIGFLYGIKTNVTRLKRSVVSGIFVMQFGLFFCYISCLILIVYLRLLAAEGGVSGAFRSTVGSIALFFGVFGLIASLILPETFWRVRRYLESEEEG